MKKAMFAGAASALALLVAGCGSNEEAALNEQNTAASDMNAMMVDPNNPFAGSMQQMMGQMMAAVGSNVGQNWARKMIVHHQGAIDMSRIVLDRNPTPEVASLAQETIEKQTREIAEIRKLLEEGPPDQQSAALYRPAMMEMQQKMMAASGSDISETFLLKMAEHHRGAVAMSDIALENGATGPIRDQVQKTKAAQVKEIEMVDAILGGEAPPSVAAASAPPEAVTSEAPTPAARDTGASPSTARPATSAEPEPEPEPEPADPHAGHDMNNMSH